jgi:hypothetical protein
VASLPKNVQLSSPPITGSYRIKCFNPDGSQNTTVDIGMWNSSALINTAIINSCPFYRDKLQIFDGYSHVVYPEDGRDIYIRFIGLNMDIPQFQVISSPDDPLIANKAVLNSTTFIDYNTSNIFYEPVPFEFLYTNEKSPQVIVSIEGIEAVCDSLNCNYNYI